MVGFDFTGKEGGNGVIAQYGENNMRMEEGEGENIGRTFLFYLDIILSCNADGGNWNHDGLGTHFNHNTRENR